MTIVKRPDLASTPPAPFASSGSAPRLRARTCTRTVIEISMRSMRASLESYAKHLEQAYGSDLTPAELEALTMAHGFVTRAAECLARCWGLP
jgi:hypothetical protein